MVCSFARFVIHYKDGSTVIEDRNDPYSWDNAPKENISALGIQFDHKIIRNSDGSPVRDKITGKIIREVYPEHTMKGSKKYKYFFFQFKKAEILLKPGETGETYGLCIGKVIDSTGKCIVHEGRPDRNVYEYNTTVRSLALNLELFGINLEECGTEFGIQ